VAVEHQMSVTIDEDREIIEAQHRNRSAARGQLEERLVRADRAAVMARRVYDSILDSEAAAASV
jgi:phenylpropionate dioxygenase-like ring-hydroxylating dioxygenase large terminal subunit